MFKKPDAISLAPICKGINKLLKVPLRPAVNTKKTMIVPCMVTSARYTLGSITPPSAHLPSSNSNTTNGSSGHASCILIKIDIAIPMNTHKQSCN